MWDNSNQRPIYYWDRSLPQDPIVPDTLHYLRVAKRLNYRSTPEPCIVIVHSDLCYTHLC